MNTLLATVCIGAIPLGFSIYAMRDAIIAKPVASGCIIDRSLAAQATAWSVISLGLVIALYCVCEMLKTEYPNDTTVPVMSEAIGVFQLWSALGAVAPYFVIPVIFGRALPIWRAGSAGTESGTMGRSKWMYSVLAIVCVIQIYGGGLCMIIMRLRLEGVLHK